MAAEDSSLDTSVDTSPPDSTSLPADVAEDVDTSDDSAVPDDAVADDAAVDAPVVDAGCSDRPDGCATDAADPFRDLMDACIEVEWTCGYLYLQIDLEGCLVERSLARPAPKFRACVVEQLQAKRHACWAGSTTWWLSCAAPT